MSYPFKPTTYMLRVGMEPDRQTGGWRMWTKPALQRAHGRPNPLADQWIVTYPDTVPPRVLTYPSEAAARVSAARAIGLLAGEQMKSQFSGPQRIAMGQMKCPYRAGDGSLCMVTASIGTVWCSDHEGVSRA